MTASILPRSKNDSRLFRFRPAGMLRLGLCLFCLLSSGVSTVSALQENENPQLQQALNRMDEIAKAFRTFSADFSQKKYTAILEEFDIPETGKFYYSKARNGSVLMRHQIVDPGDRILTIKDGEAIIFNRAINQAQIKDLGKGQELAEYLTLGIGQTSAKLREKFDISYGGSESINGEACTILVLKPKEEKVKRYLASITIWLKKSDGMPAQYKFLQPNQDYMLETFSDEKLNEKIPESMFEQKLSKDVEKIRL